MARAVRSAPRTHCRLSSSARLPWTHPSDAVREASTCNGQPPKSPDSAIAGSATANISAGRFCYRRRGPTQPCRRNEDRHRGLLQVALPQLGTAPRFRLHLLTRLRGGRGFEYSSAERGVVPSAARLDCDQWILAPRPPSADSPPGSTCPAIARGGTSSVCCHNAAIDRIYDFVVSASAGTHLPNTAMDTVGYHRGARLSGPSTVGRWSSVSFWASTSSTPPWARFKSRSDSSH